MSWKEFKDVYMLHKVLDFIMVTPLKKNLLCSANELQPTAYCFPRNGGFQDWYYGNVSRHDPEVSDGKTAVSHTHTLSVADQWRTSFQEVTHWSLSFKYLNKAFSMHKQFF